MSTFKRHGTKSNQFVQTKQIDASGKKNFREQAAADASEKRVSRFPPYAHSKKIYNGKDISQQIMRVIKEFHAANNYQPGDQHMVHYMETDNGHVMLKFNEPEYGMAVLNTAVPTFKEPNVLAISNEKEHKRVNRFMSRFNKETGEYEEVDFKTIKSDVIQDFNVRCKYDGKVFSLVFFVPIGEYSNRVKNIVDMALDDIYSAIVAPRTFRTDDNGKQVENFINLGQVIRDSMNRSLSTRQQTTVSAGESADQIGQATNMYAGLNLDEGDAPAPVADTRRKHKKKGPAPVSELFADDEFPTLGSAPAKLENKAADAYAKAAAMNPAISEEYEEDQYDDFVPAAAAPATATFNPFDD